MIWTDKIDRCSPHRLEELGKRSFPLVGGLGMVLEGPDLPSHIVFIANEEL